MITPVTIHVSDKTNLEPVEAATVTVWNSDYTEMVYDGVTNSNGDLLVGLEPEPVEYNVFFAKSGYSFYPHPTRVGVGEEPAVFSIEGTPIASPPSIPMGLVWLCGTVADTSLNPLINTPVNVFLLGTPQTRNGAVLERSTTTVYTDSDGKWGILLAGGTRVSVTILAGKYSKSGILPFEGTIEVNDLGLYG